MQTTLTIKGMHCGSCKALIEDVCGEIAGVRSCTVDVGTGKAVVEHDDTLDPTTLVEAITGLGDYQAMLV